MVLVVLGVLAVGLCVLPLFRMLLKARDEERRLNIVEEKGSLEALLGVVPSSKMGQMN